MKCVLTGQNAAILAKAIHSFARIGNELYVEADSKTGLSLRTVNMTKSAFSSILFNLDFFASFVVKSNNTDENQCKLSMKSCLGVFRNMKQVESCTMTMDSKASKLIVQFKCRLETTRTHHISILEQETLQAVYFTDRSLNILGGNHKLFSNIVTNFKANEEELSIKATVTDIVVQNYAEGTHVDHRFVRSQMTLKPDEFESFKIGESTTITFCMRELRAILNFAESMNTSISANFDTAGKPVVFVIKDFNTFEANLVMSTLSPEDEEYECQKSRSLVQITSHSHVDIDLTNAESDKEPVNDDNDSNCSALSISKNKKRNLPNTIGSDFEFGINRHTSPDVIRKKRRTSNEHRRDTRLPPETTTNQTKKTQPEPMDLDSENIEVVFQDDSPQTNSFEQNNSSEETLNPENARDHRVLVRQAFRRCFTGNTQPRKPLGPVLVEASSDEE